ncbi:hypothetical protein [Chryseobacterium terrae]|uniref:PEP-CTERM protein-sorting domain-containing protein n=1 Tax=Chryseobacterium terrae TaxID=3163299 RepID=A0ABW8Y8K8_9FLAO
MKKIIIMFTMALSGFAFAQDTSENPFIYDTDPNEVENVDEDVYPANPGEAPIDDYIPALFVVGVAFAIAYANKKKAI